MDGVIRITLKGTDMKIKTLNRIALCGAMLVLFSGCSRDLIKTPLVASRDRWDMTLVALTLGPDQYNMAGGYWEPRQGKHFAWAKILLRNKLKTDQQFNLERIFLSIGGKQIKPFILDMDSAVAMRANPEPRLKPNEFISRKLIYIVPRDTNPEKIVYENADIVIPDLKAR
jgi:hypothetical protein